MTERVLTPETWLAILASAYTLFDDAEARGFGTLEEPLIQGTKKIGGARASGMRN